MSQGELDSCNLSKIQKISSNQTIFLHNLHLALFQCFIITNTKSTKLISIKLENESGVKVVLKPTEEMDDDKKDI
jgi:hypothetical protein